VKKLFVAVLIVLFGTQSFSQDLNKGLKAYNAGDYATALKEWKPLAEEGNARAQHNLGVMYQLGRGVLQNNVTAHMWYNIALANGREKAVEWRDKVAGLMTADAIEIATAMARKCMTTNYKKCGD